MGTARSFGTPSRFPEPAPGSDDPDKTLCRRWVPRGPQSISEESTCPSRIVREAPRSAPPEGPGSYPRAPATRPRPAWERPCGCRCTEVAEIGSCVDPSGKSIFALGVIVQGPPEETID